MVVEEALALLLHEILNLFESKAENPQAGFLFKVAGMCASGIPVSSGGWEEVRSIDSEEETIKARRAGAGKVLNLGHGNPTSLLFPIGHKSIFNNFSLSIFPILYVSGVELFCSIFSTEQSL